MGYSDFMYLAIGVGVLLVAIFGSVALFYLIFILRDVSKTTENVRETTERVNEYIISPIRVANTVIEKAKSIYDAIMERKDEYEKKSRKKKKN